MSRKQFIESLGATCGNWRNSWAFVNHSERFIIFGAWDVYTSEDRALIFAEDWQFNDKGRKQAAFKEAAEFINLVENEGYSLKTFPIILDEDFDDPLDTGRSQIKAHIEELTIAELVKEGDAYYAVGMHKPEYAKKASPAFVKEIGDIFDSVVEQTERESLVLSRIGQGKFRNNVIQVFGNGERCALTLIDVRELLVASHIVPWSKCTSNEQRLDGANGILLCSHIDKLFDSHLLTFVKRGNRYVAKLSPKLDRRQLKGLGVEEGDELCTDNIEVSFKKRFEDYLQSHNETFELKALL